MSRIFGGMNIIIEFVHQLVPNESNVNLAAVASIRLR